MITDRQVRHLRQLLAAGEILSRAAWKTGMDPKTARKYRDGKLPSERATEHTWRTREDPFAEIWEEVHEQLAENPGLQAKTLFDWLGRKYPGRFDDGQLRTFQRGVKRWRAAARGLLQPSAFPRPAGCVGLQFNERPGRYDRSAAFRAYGLPFRVDLLELAVGDDLLFGEF